MEGMKRIRNQSTADTIQEGHEVAWFKKISRGISGALRYNSLQLFTPILACLHYEVSARECTHGHLVNY
jgi:hypothetical protein